ncbi:unnamed protein product [Strongylus vulgaris]|uniref:Uncharacterized protein n=1 Tax=Strongylus vulgaris TaxID=40348 RepID=A0A3P7IKU3_STRVU|nr:unnamed protein product [Strongylus vulgaris]
MSSFGVDIIGRIEPPTPGGTREPSTTGEPDRPPVDDHHNHVSHSERLFKPHSECELYVSGVKATSDIKLSHSDSSIYEGSSCSRTQDITYSRPRLKESKKLDTLPNVKR